RTSATAAATSSTTSATAAGPACPGARTKKPATVIRAAKPTGGSSQLQPRRPIAASSARPTSSDAAQTIAAEMYVAIIGAANYGSERCCALTVATRTARAPGSVTTAAPT